MNADSPSTKSADYGMMASAVCRTGIPFTPQNFSALVQVAATTEHGGIQMTDIMRASIGLSPTVLAERILYLHMTVRQL